MDIAIQIERIAAGTVGLGGNVIFDNEVYSSGNIAYDDMTGAITFNEPGRYVVHWWVATQASASVNGAVFSFSSSQGDVLLGNSPIKTGEVVGVSIIDVAAAPITASLVNVSTADIFYSVIVPIKAMLVIVQDDLVASGPTGPTATIIYPQP